MDLGLSCQVYRQKSNKIWRIFPTKLVLFSSLGGNLTDRQDLVRNDPEEVEFWRLMGLPKHIRLRKENVAGAHLDAWNLAIDGRSERPQMPPRKQLTLLSPPC